jgi:hypothetical protein
MSPNPLPGPQREAGADLHILRRMLLLILLFSLAGSCADLLLMGHYDDIWQKIPLIVFGVAAVTLLWHVARHSAASVRAIQLLMLLFIVVGISGGVLHFRAGAEFHSEMEPEQSRWSLIRAVLGSTAPPVLAPAVLLQMGLIGLAYAYRHPALRRSAVRDSQGDPT